MNTNRNSGENLTELVFENKNKAYGAYAIRSSYGDNVTFSLFITLSFFGLLASFAIWASNKGPVLPSKGGNEFIDSVFIQEIDNTPKEKEPESQPKTEKKEAPKSTTGHPEVTDQKVVDTSHVDNNTPIKPNANPNGKVDTADTHGTVVVSKKKEEEGEDLKKIRKGFELDKIPYMDNMNQFIVDNLKYPQTAISNGTTGIVVIGFVVEADGTLSNLEILNSVPDGCDAAALRVMKMMPLWHPGYFKNLPRRSQCTLPIRFKLK